MIQSEFTWEFNYQQFDIYSKLVGVDVNGGVPHPISGLFFSPAAQKYPEFLEKLSEETGVGYNYCAVHFADVPAWNLSVPEGTVKVVDFQGDALVDRITFHKIALDFAKTALAREAELELVESEKLPADWRSRIEATLPKLEALAQAEEPPVS